MKYVIIGNSAAAIGAVEGIRKQDQSGEIVMISSEPHHTYSRPLISYLIYGKTTLKKMNYRGEDFYRDNGCKFIHGTVTRILADKKHIVLENGETIGYDKLLVATGSSPFVPPMEGLESVEKKFGFMCLDDALALQKELDSEKEALIVGAGLIGLKAAEGILSKVKKVTAIDLADRILPSILDEEGSQMVKEHIEGKGVEFILSDSVERFEKNQATLKSGKQIHFDILIVAVGVRPNTQLIKVAGGNVNRGIVTDEYCRTSLKDIYAAGDCTESFDVSSGENRILALLPNAYMQGECAGIHMAGGDKIYEKAIPMNAIGFFGLSMITAGSYQGESLVSKGDKTYKKLVLKDNCLKGYIMIGEIARAGIYTSLIKNKIPIEEIDFELLKEKPQILAFSKITRKEMLGGIKR